MKNVFDKAADTVSGGHWNPCHQPQVSDFGFRGHDGWHTDWKSYDTAVAAYDNRQRGKVGTKGAVLGFPNSYQYIGYEHSAAYCSRGALREWAMFYPLGFPHPVKMHFANKTSREMHGVSVLVFNDKVCRNEAEAVAFLQTCSQAWRQRGLRKHWVRYLGWLGAGAQVRSDLPIIDYRWRQQLTVPADLIDGWPPDQVPEGWAAEKVSA